jgi:outer membrane lipoprotein-sorting protein
MNTQRLAPQRLKPEAVVRIALCALSALCLLPAAAKEEPPSDAEARAILRKADEIRFPTEGFEVAVRIRTVEAGAEGEVRQYKVLSKGNESSIVMTLAPAAERGQMLLMKGRDLWLFVPNVSQPVRLSLAQRLTGLVANGDIARANFSGDYNPRLIGVETIDGQSYQVLDLTAADRGTTYPRVKYWVRQGDFFPFKAEFYSLSGRLLKTCLYDSHKPLGGRTRPTRLIMTDALKADSQSVMEYSDMRNRELPDKVFTKEYLKKLE